MIGAISDHLLQSTLFLAGVALLTLVFRKNRAQVRYWLWTSASLKFVLPFAALIAIGQQLPWPVPVERIQLERVVMFDSTFEAPVPPGLPLLPTAAAAVPSALSTTIIVTAAAIWLTGMVVVLALWLVRWRRVATIIRNATPLEEGPVVAALARIDGSLDGTLDGSRRPSGLRIRISDTSLEPGVFGIWNPVLLWPRRIGERLDTAQIEAILQHELCHVRRRDNLLAVIHTVVQAMFWFHPLVWWLGERLVEERERACDEDVVTRGSEPEVYAESILRTCQFCLEAPVACMAGVTGSDLKQRMERIMTRRGGAELSVARKALLTTIGIAAVATPVIVGAANSPREIRQVRMIARVAHAPLQGSAPASPGPQTFEVASVKPNRTGDARSMLGMPPGGRLTATNVLLRTLVQQAFQVQDFQMAGGPAWIDSERFDVDARAGREIPPSPPGTIGPMQAMIQALLADRFRLRTHREVREQPIYSLVLARDDGRPGPQLRTAGNECAPVKVPGGFPAPPPPPGGPQAAGAPAVCPSLAGPFFISGRRMTMAQLASGLATRVGRMVVDQTGLPGNFDFELSFTPDNAPPGQLMRFNGVEFDAGPSIYTAVQEQLGLKLESTRGPVEVLVIDSVERPSEN